MTHDELLRIFVYEPDMGTLRKVLGARKPYPWRRCGKQGRYLVTTVGGKNYYLHRLVWFYHHGYVPQMIDHIDGDPSNNRIENLRECTDAQNQYNSVRKINNRSGHKGVVHHRRCVSRPWQAKIVVRKKVVSLGYYSTKEEAAAAYLAGAELYAGKFARAGD